MTIFERQLLAAARHVAYAITCRVDEQHAIEPGSTIVCTNRQTTVFGHLPVPVQVQHCFGVQAAKIDAGAVGVHHIDVKVILGARPHVLTRIESVPGPLLMLSEQSKPPIELLGIEIEAEQAVEAG